MKQILANLVAWVDATGVEKNPALAGIDIKPLQRARAALKPQGAVPLYVELAQLVETAIRCAGPDANESQRAWGPRHIERAHALVKEFMPSGSGFDNGTKLIVEESGPDALVFHSSYHKMDEHGGYSGWADFAVIIKASLHQRFALEVRCADAVDDAEHGDFFAETFYTALVQDIDLNTLYTMKGL